MKKGLLFTLSIALCFGAVAQQVTQHLPHGFQRAHMPASMKKFTKSPLPGGGIDNQVPVSTQGMPLRTAPLAASSNFMDDEAVLGGSFYDLQTNNSISNRLSVNDDGTISAAWTFSPSSPSPPSYAALSGIYAPRSRLVTCSPRRCPSTPRSSPISSSV